MTDRRTLLRSESVAWRDVPKEERRRLQRNEKAQRYKTRRMGLPALPISVEGLWLVQSGMCTCNECRGRVPLEIGHIVIAHTYYRAGKGSPGHVPTNVALWLAECNRREAVKEKRALERGRRMSVNLQQTPTERSDICKPDPWNRKFKRKLNGQVVKR